MYERSPRLLACTAAPEWADTHQPASAKTPVPGKHDVIEPLFSDPTSPSVSRSGGAKKHPLADRLRRGGKPTTPRKAGTLQGSAAPPSCAASANWRPPTIPNRPTTSPERIESCLGSRRPRRKLNNCGRTGSVCVKSRARELGSERFRELCRGEICGRSINDHVSATAGAPRFVCTPPKCQGGDVRRRGP